MGSPILDCTSICKLGKKVILSGALMEAGVAAFIQAESEKIEALTEKYKASNPIIPPTKEDIIKANEEATKAFEAIKGIEEKIVEKITIGRELYETSPDTCPCEE
ncbi:MAG: hypothetical protein RR645_05650 [Clostridium sp.]